MSKLLMQRNGEVWYLIPGQARNAVWLPVRGSWLWWRGTKGRQHQRWVALSGAAHVISHFLRQPWKVTRMTLSTGHPHHPVRLAQKKDSPVSGRPRDPAARRWHQHGIPFLGQPHPLLHKPCFPLYIILCFLCGTKWGDEQQGGRKYNFYIKSK